MAKRKKKRVNPILEARRLEAERAAGGQSRGKPGRAADPVSMRSLRGSSRSRSKKKEKQGLKLYRWVSTLVACYLVALLGFIYLTQGDQFPIEDVATSFVGMLLISSMVIAIPTLLVWIFSRSPKGSNYTCVGAVVLLSVLIFPRFLFVPEPPQQTDPAGKGTPQAPAELGAMNQAPAVIENAITDVLALAKKWERDTAAYAEAGAYDPRTLRGRYALDTRILQLQNLIHLTQQLKAVYPLQEQSIRDALEPMDLTGQERDTLLTAWRDAATPELFDQARTQDLIVFSHHLQLLDLVKQYPEWQMRSDGYMIFVNHSEISDRYNEQKKQLNRDMQLVTEYDKQIKEQRKRTDKKYNP